MDIKEIQNDNINILRHPWELARVEILIRFLKEATQNIDKSAISIIDIGCGDLFVLEKISDILKFDEFYGIDIAIDDENVKRLESKYQRKKIHILNDLTNLTIHKNNISIVLLNDIIEHVVDDKTFLLNLQENSFINEKTIFIITVPAFQYLFCSHDTYLEHYRRYNNSQLVKLLKNSNYIINSDGYFFFSLLIPRLVKVFKEKNFGIQKKQNEIKGTDLTNWKGNKFVSLLIKNILLFDYFLTSFFKKLKIKIPGLSTYAICKKSV